MPVRSGTPLPLVLTLLRSAVQAMQSLRPGTGEQFDEKITGDATGDGRAEATYKPSSYVYCRAIFLRMLSLAFLAAFASLFVQVQGLMGSDGLSPAWEVVDDALKGKTPSPANFIATLAGSHMPLVDAWLDIMCLAGMALAGLGLAGYATMLSVGSCWLLYLSLSSIGGIWLEAKWDMLLLETGFLGALWAPLWLSRSSARPPSYVVLMLLRLALFKTLIMQALSKLEDKASGDDWRALTALQTRYATDSIPTPTIYYYHYLPSALFQLTAAYILTVEIVGAFYVLSPINLARHWTAGLISVLPLLDMLSGNYGFYPMVLFCLIVPLFEDTFWVWVLRVDEGHQVEFPLTSHSSSTDKESTPLITIPRASAYGTGAADAWEESSDEENQAEGQNTDVVLDTFKASNTTVSGWTSILDQANQDPKISIAAAVAHLVPVVLFALFFFTVDFDAHFEESCMVVRLSPKFIRDIFGVLIPLYMGVFFLVLVFWMAVELLASSKDLYYYTKGSTLKWARILKLSVALVGSLLVCTFAVLITLANRAALGGIAYKPFGAIVLQQVSHTRVVDASHVQQLHTRYAKKHTETYPSPRDFSATALPSQRSLEKTVHDKFPAFRKALHDEALPWGKMLRGLETLQHSLGKHLHVGLLAGQGQGDMRATHWSGLSDGQGDDEGIDGTWAGAAYRALAPLKIANSYESRLLPSWKSETEGVNKWGGIRTEVEIQESTDPDCAGGEVKWTDVDLRYELGSPLRPPAWSGLHVPRLDWHVLAEAQHEHDWRSAPWFVNLMGKLLTRPAAVMSLLAVEAAIQREAPICVRATVYNYELARHDEFGFFEGEFENEIARNDFAEQHAGEDTDGGGDGEDGGEGGAGKKVSPPWWFRTQVRVFTPPLTRELMQCSPQPDCLPEGDEDDADEEVGGDGGQRRLLSSRRLLSHGRTLSHPSTAERDESSGSEEEELSAERTTVVSPMACSTPTTAVQVTRRAR